MRTLSDRKVGSSKPKKLDKGYGCSNVAYREEHDGFYTIFKPRKGEDKELRERGVLRKGIPFYKREVLAYEIDKLFGFGLVPITVAVEVPEKGWGSRQLWVDGNDDETCYKEMSKRAGDQLKLMCFLDIVIGNTDRHGSNLLYDKEKNKVWAIDNGLSFPTRMDEVVLYCTDRNMEKEIRKGQYGLSKAFFSELPKDVITSLRRITRRQFMYRCKKYGLSEEGELAWNRFQALVSL